MLLLALGCMAQASKAGVRVLGRRGSKSASTPSELIPPHNASIPLTPVGADRPRAHDSSSTSQTVLQEACSRTAIARGATGGARPNKTSTRVRKGSAKSRRTAQQNQTQKERRSGASLPGMMMRSERRHASCRNASALPRVGAGDLNVSASLSKGSGRSAQGKPRRCSAPEGCEKQPSFGDPYEGKARFCAAHREPGHICVRARKCEHLEGCMKRALYHDRARGVYVCGTHRYYLTVKPTKAVRLASDRCSHDGCNLSGIYGRVDYGSPGLNVSLSMSFDKLQNGSRLVAAGGAHHKAGARPTGAQGKAHGKLVGGKERFCAAHRRPGDVNLRNKRCRAAGCLRSPSFGLPSHLRPCAALATQAADASHAAAKPNVALYCRQHCPAGWVDLRNRRCDQCHRRATWGERRLPSTVAAGSPVASAARTTAERRGHDGKPPCVQARGAADTARARGLLARAPDKSARPWLPAAGGIGGGGLRDGSHGPRRCFAHRLPQQACPCPLALCVPVRVCPLHSAHQCAMFEDPCTLLPARRSVDAMCVCVRACVRVFIWVSVCLC